MIFNGEDEGKLILMEEISCEEEDAWMKKKVNKWPAVAGCLTCVDAIGNKYQ